MWENKVQYRKYSLFYFTGIDSPSYQYHFFCEIDDREIVLACTIDSGVGHKPGSGDYRPFRVGSSVANLRPQKQVICKQVLVCRFSNYAYAHAVFFAGTSTAVTYKNILICQVAGYLMQQGIKFSGIKFQVYLSLAIGIAGNIFFII